jgi:hypothetical protein
MPSMDVLLCAQMSQDQALRASQCPQLVRLCEGRSQQHRIHAEQGSARRSALCLTSEAHSRLVGQEWQDWLLYDATQSGSL